MLSVPSKAKVDCESNTISESSEDRRPAEDVDRAFNTLLDLPENKDLIEGHIKKLTEQTLAARAAFENISSSSPRLTAENTRRNMLVTYRPFAPLGIR